MSLPDCPTHRATLTATELVLSKWTPKLFGGGPGQNLLRAAPRGVTFADLMVIDEPPDREVIVRPLQRPLTPAHRELLTAWARDTGHRRIWFPDAVEELAGAPLELGVAVTRCRSCRTRWSDGDPGFWLAVRDRGMFPSGCPNCGGQLPQWRRLPAVPGACPAAAESADTALLRSARNDTPRGT